MKSKQQLVFEVLVRNLDKKSKFFKDDMQALKKIIDEKTEDDLDETLLRWRAIMATTDAETIKNCQI